VNDFSGRHLQQRDTVLLDVSTEHNGQYQPGSPPSGKSRIVERFDKFGNLVSVTDLRRAVTESEFHVATGAPKFVKVKFNRPFPQGTHTIQTSFKSDQLGRITQVLGPEHDAVVDVSTGAIARVRTATWHVYKDISGQLWTAHGHVAGQTEVQINPLQIDRVDRAGRVTDSILALRSQQGRPSPQETMIGRQNWGGWVSRQHDDRSRLVESRVYHRIPSVGTGAQGVNFDATRTKFDEG
jgi:hypothetical protein